MAVRIHPTAIVHPGAELGNDVEAGPFCVIQDRVVVGDRTRVEAFAQVHSYTRIGSDCRIFSYASVGGEPQDLKFSGEESWLSIGNRTTIRENCTINRGTAGGGGETRIGDNCLLMAYVHVAHDCRVGNGVILSNAAMLAGHVVIEDCAVIGGMSGVHQFVRVGEYAFVGAMSGLPQDLPPYMLAAGSRARMHGPNLIGLRRYAFSPEFIPALRTVYKRIFRSDTPRKEALDSVEAEFGHFPQMRTLVEFIRSSERGILSPSGKTGEVDDDDDAWRVATS